MGGTRRVTGGPDPLENQKKNIGFLCNTGPDPLKNHKATNPAFSFGPLSATLLLLTYLIINSVSLAGR